MHLHGPIDPEPETFFKKIKGYRHEIYLLKWLKHKMKNNQTSEHIDNTKKAYTCTQKFGHFNL